MAKWIPLVFNLQKYYHVVFEKLMKCRQCNLEFQETSIQFCKRLRNNSKPICRDCNRIELAEERAQKRVEKKKKNNLGEMIRKQIITLEKAKKIKETNKKVD